MARLFTLFQNWTGAQLKKATDGLKNLLPLRLRQKKAGRADVGMMTLVPQPTADWSEGVVDDAAGGVQVALPDSIERKALAPSPSEAIDDNMFVSDEGMIVEPFTEMVYITQVISRKDPKHASEGAVAARRNLRKWL